MSPIDTCATPTDDPLSGLTIACVTFATGLRFEDVPAEVVALSRRCLIDGCDMMLAGYKQPIMAPLRRFVESQAGPGQGRLLADAAVRVPAPKAAL